MERLFAGKFEVVKTRQSEGFYYSNGEHEYTPPGWVKINHIWYPLGYKVVTKDNLSVGLRNSPTIYHYPELTWVKMRKEELVYSIKADEGGIWSGLNRSGASKLRDWMMNKYGAETKTYLAAIYNPFASNNYRVKSQGIMLLTELR